MVEREWRVHFVGIGGSGMSGIAEVLLNLGWRVSGSDLKATETTERLVSLGATFHPGHRAENVGEAGVVVVSSAVRPDNPEVVAARERAIPVIPRAEMLAELMRMKRGIAVAGSHGKTSTTSLVATVLAGAGLDPTAVVGGRLNAFGSGARLGQGPYLVAEADESDGSFLKLSPTIAVVTNIDPEHLDHYGDFDRLKAAFVEFANKVPFYGLVVACLDHPTIQEVLPSLSKRCVTYGLSAQADYRARGIELAGTRSRFEAWKGDRILGPVDLGIPGAHNVRNALATIAVADELGVPFETTARALRDFGGVERRFQVIGEWNGVMVVDDYGHHPEEIRATLAAAKQGWDWKRRLIVVFQPHRYSRTRDLVQDFARAFNDADVLLVTEIYAAGEEPIEGVTGRGLWEAIRAHGHRDASFEPDLARIPERIGGDLGPGDMVVTLGAGDVWKVGRALARRLAGE